MPELINTISTILHVSPTAFDPSSSLKPNIEITFSMDMMVSSLNTTLLINKVFTLVEENTNMLIQLEFVSYDTNSKLLTIRPTQDLVSGKNYQLSSGTPKDAALSLSGRSLSNPKIHLISITSYVYPTPLLLLPSNGNTLTSVPIYTAFVAPYNIPSGDIAFVEFQFSDTGYFVQNPFLTTTSVPLSGGVFQYSVTPSIAYTSGNTYWWRVRLKSTTRTSDWSEVSNFLFDTTSLQPISLDSSTVPILPGTELEISSLFDSGESNLQAWPNLTFYSNFPIAYQSQSPTGSWIGPTGQMHVYAQSVDGQYPYRDVPGKWNFFSASGFAFTPDSAIASNTRYMVVFDKTIKSLAPPFLYIPGDLNFKFSGRYVPLYAWPVQLRALFGSYVSNMSDDLLCYHLYRASLEANRYTRFFPVVTIDPGIFLNTPSLENLQVDSYNMVYSVHMFVIYKAMEYILEMSIFETITCADGATRIGDFSQNMTSSNVLRFMRDMLKDIVQKRAEYELLFSRKSGRPRTPIKSSAYPSDTMPIGDYGYGRRREMF